MPARRPILMLAAATSAATALAMLLAGCTGSSGSSATTAATSSNPTTTTTTTATATAPAPSGTATASGSTTLPTPTSGNKSAGGTSTPGPSGGPVPAHFRPTSVTFVSPQQGWVLGTAPCSHAPCTSVLRTRDGGRSWQGIPAPRASLGIPDTGRGAVSSIRFANASDGWAGVTQIYSTHDGGASWHRQQVDTPEPDSKVLSIATGGGYVFVAAAACPGSQPCAQALVFASPIGHDDWHAVSGSLGQVAEAALTVHGAEWYLPTSTGIHHGSGLSTSNAHDPNPCPSEDGERAAPLLAVPSSKDLDALCGFGGAAGTGEYRLFGSTDGGAHWARAGGTHLGPDGQTGIADNGKGVLLLAAASGASVILRTSDDGQSFHEATVAAPVGGYAWSDLGFTTSSQAVVVLPGHDMYLSHDAGARFGKVRF